MREWVLIASKDPRVVDVRRQLATKEWGSLTVVPSLSEIPPAEDLLGNPSPTWVHLDSCNSVHILNQFERLVDRGWLPTRFGISCLSVNKTVERLGSMMRAAGGKVVIAHDKPGRDATALTDELVEAMMLHPDTADRLRAMTRQDPQVTLGALRTLAAYGDVARLRPDDLVRVVPVLAEQANVWACTNLLFSPQASQMASIWEGMRTTPAKVILEELLRTIVHLQYFAIVGPKQWSQAAPAAGLSVKTSYPFKAKLAFISQTCPGQSPVSVLIGAQQIVNDAIDMLSEFGDAENMAERHMVKTVFALLQLD